jgi:hypothetical protein
VDSDYTAITGKQSVTASALSGKKGKGRRKKGVEGSVKSSAQKGARDTRSVTGGPDVEEEDDEDGGGDDGVVDDGVKVDKDAAEKKMAYVRFLTSMFTIGEIHTLRTGLNAMLLQNSHRCVQR